MDNMKYFDVDGFELEFEHDTPTKERDYYAQQYPNVNWVAKKRIHCTSCNSHIGTSPSAEIYIRMHKVLRVTQCVKCYKFYNNGEFDRGEDGSELYCRWCGQGGELLCCSKCPYVFCQKCVLRNFFSNGLKEILSNDNWKCYACTPKILYPLRAQHWALVNFIKKQTKALDSKMSKGLRDQDKIAYYTKKDSSTCCPSKSTASRRRPKVSSDEDDDSWSEPSDNESINRSKKRVKTDEKPKADLRNDINSAVARYEVKPRQNGLTRPTSTSTTNRSTAMQRLSMVQHRMTSTSPATTAHRNNNSLTNGIHRPKEPFYFSTDDVSRARRQLESETLNAMEICRHIDGKLKEFMNSLPYRAANKMSNIKDLYIHLSQLLTYTNDRVESLKEKCMDDIRQFGLANNAGTLPLSSDTCRSEIVVPSNTIITIDDSDEEHSFTIENLECPVDIADIIQLDNDEGNLDDAEDLGAPAALEKDHNNYINDDKKLKSKVKIVLRRAENEFPDVMRKALLQIMNRLIEDNKRRKQIEDAKRMEENETGDNEQGIKIEPQETNVEMV